MRTLLALLVLTHAALADLPPEIAKAQWRVRDVAADSAWLDASNATKVGLKRDEKGDTCTVTDTTERDRLVTLAFCVPISGESWTWWDDPQRHRPANGDKPLCNVTDNAGGLNNQASFYPLAVMSTADRAVCLAVPPSVPRMVRFIYDPARKELRAEFDFGLSPVPEHYKSKADATVTAFTVPPKWPFRQALARYYTMFPDAFVRRVKHTGIWFPFNETASIENPQDFGFGYHEVAESQISDPRAGKKLVDDDHRIACGSYLYTEPQTYWQQYTGSGKGTFQERFEQLEAEAKAGNKMAQGVLVSGIIRSTGKRDLYMDGVPYTTQLPWGCNADPAIPDDAARGYPSKANVELEKMERALGWRDPRTRSDIGLDGVYVDSSEGWGEILNYNHDHWRVSRYPLTFDPVTKKVALLNFWGTYAWVKEMASRLHARNKILMANDAFYRKWQLLPFIDVPGREYTWISKDGQFTPVPDERYLFFRAMASKRPYCMLMNNDYDRGEFMPAYFQRSVFYAVYPSMYFGHTSASDKWYFAHADYYNRDRKLFKHYIPIIRKLDEAGWEPVPYAEVSPAEIRIERYGRMSESNLAFTVYNPTKEPQRITLRVLKRGLGIPGGVSATELIASRTISVESGDEDLVPLLFELPSQGYAALKIDPGPGGY